MCSSSSVVDAHLRAPMTSAAAMRRQCERCTSVSRQSPDPCGRAARPLCRCRCRWYVLARTWASLGADVGQPCYSGIVHCRQRTGLAAAAPVPP
jgi:hypothetical protein